MASRFNRRKTCVGRKCVVKTFFPCGEGGFSERTDRVDNTILAFPHDLPDLDPDLDDEMVIDDLTMPMQTTAETSAATSSDTPYHKRKERTTAAWEVLRSSLFEAAVEEEGLSAGDLCQVCTKEEAFYRCLECPLRFQCFSCCKEIHIDKCQIHKIEKMEGGLFNIVDMNYLLKKPNNCCSSTYSCDIILTTSQGSQHQAKVEFCQCEPEAITLMRRGFFPATPTKPELAFSINLLKWLEALFLESHISILDFGHSIQFLLKDVGSNLLRNIYPSLLDAFEEFRFLQHRLRHFSLGSGKLQCPACPKKNGIITVGVDACFGLPRKTTAGMSYREALQRDTYFINQNEVDLFVQNAPRPTVAEKNEECSDFKAGSIITKGRYERLDETAVFGMACKHGFPLDFLNLKGGERFQNAVLLLMKLQETYRNKDIDIHFFYDVACQFQRYLKNHRIKMFDAVEMAVPAFHIYGHKASCQVKYSPRRLPGWGMADGEMLERLWSYLRLFSRTTKEMSASHRIDVLCSALFNVAHKLLMSIGPHLQKKLISTEKTQEAMQEELQKLCEINELNISPGIIEVWANEENYLLNVDDVSKIGTTNSTDDWRIEYKELLEAWYIKSSSSTSSQSISHTRQVSRLERKLVNIEVQQRIERRWVPSDSNYKDAHTLSLRRQLEKALDNVRCSGRRRWFCSTLMKKYADGQAIAKRLCQVLNREERTLKRMVAKYNTIAETLCQIPGLTHPVSRLTLEEARNIEGAIYNDSVETCEQHIPPALKRKAIETFHVLKRCGEEIDIIHSEMHNVLGAFINDLSQLKSQIPTALQTKYDIGISFVTERKIVMTKTLLAQACKNFEKHINIPEEILDIVSLIPSSSFCDDQSLLDTDPFELIDEELQFTFSNDDDDDDDGDEHDEDDSAFWSS